MIDVEVYAVEHKLPRLVWRARGFRLVQYVADDDGRLTLGLEQRDGCDYLGQERWKAVSFEPSPAEGWAWVSRDWVDAFYALAGCVFAPGATLLDLPLIVGEDDANTAEDTADIPY